MSDLLSTLPNDVFYYLVTQYLCEVRSSNTAKCHCRLLVYNNTIKLSKYCKSMNVRPTIDHFRSNCRPHLFNLLLLMRTSKTLFRKTVDSRSCHKMVSLLSPVPNDALTYLITSGWTTLFKALPEVLKIKSGARSNTFLNKAIEKSRIGSAMHLYQIVGYQPSQSLLKLRHLLKGKYESFVVCERLKIPIYYSHVLESMKIDPKLWHPSASLSQYIPNDDQRDLTLDLCLIFKKRCLIDYMMRHNDSDPSANDPQRILHPLIVGILSKQVPTLESACFRIRPNRPTFETLLYCIEHSVSLFAFQTLFFYFGRPATPLEWSLLVDKAVKHDRVDHLDYFEKFAPILLPNFLKTAIIAKSWNVLAYYTERGVQIANEDVEQIRDQVKLDCRILTEKYTIVLLKLGYYERDLPIYTKSLDLFALGELAFYLTKNDFNYVKWVGDSVARWLAYSTLISLHVP